MIDIVEKPLLEDVKEYQGKWRNIYFRKNGSFVVDGDGDFDTAALAKDDIEKVTGNMEKGGHIGFYRGEDIIFMVDFSHAIPMPIGA